MKKNKMIFIVVLMAQLLIGIKFAHASICDNYPYSLGINIQDVQGGMRIVATVSNNDGDFRERYDQFEDAKKEAKQLLQQFLINSIKSDSAIASAVHSTLSMQGPDKEQLRNDVIERTKRLESSSEFLLRNVVLLEHCNKYGYPNRVSVGIKPEKIAELGDISKLPIRQKLTPEQIALNEGLDLEQAWTCDPLIIKGTDTSNMFMLRDCSGNNRTYISSSVGISSVSNPEQLKMLLSFMKAYDIDINNPDSFTNFLNEKKSRANRVINTARALGFRSDFLASTLYVKYLGLWVRLMPCAEWIELMQKNKKITSIQGISEGGNPGVSIKRIGRPPLGFVFRMNGKEAYAYAYIEEGHMKVINSPSEHSQAANFLQGLTDEKVMN